MTTATEWLIAQGVRTLGLETMPRTVENIGFYSALGYAPGPLTITLTNDIRRRGLRKTEFLSKRSVSARQDTIEACHVALDRVVPGYDFTREIQLTQALHAGDTTVIETTSEVLGFALWHSAPLAQGRPRDELRVLKLFARDDDTFGKLVTSLEAAATRIGVRRIAFRCQTRFGRAYRALVGRGYRVRWTDLRMTYDGHEEPVVDRATVLSNWEV